MTFSAAANALIFSLQVSGQVVEVVSEEPPSQLARKMGTWDETLSKTLQNVVVVGESSIHPEAEEQLLYAKNIGHEVRFVTTEITQKEQNISEL